MAAEAIAEAAMAEEMAEEMAMWRNAVTLELLFK